MGRGGGGIARRRRREDFGCKITAKPPHGQYRKSGNVANLWAEAYYILVMQQQEGGDLPHAEGRKMAIGGEIA